MERIFSEFANGREPAGDRSSTEPRGNPGPRGGSWSMSTIYGNWRRGTGILNNELYLGRLVWNRQRFVKDPGAADDKQAAQSGIEWVTEKVPDLQIVSEELWDG